MIRYCDCNSSVPQDYDNSDEQIVELSWYGVEGPSVSGFEAVVARIEQHCPVCEMFFWHRAWEENMLFDLKQMNS